MAKTRLKIPTVDELRSDRLIFHYDDEADTLYVHFYGYRQPGESVQLTDHMFVRVRPGSDEVIGIQIEEFLIAAVDEHPGLLALAELARIPERSKEQWRSRREAATAGSRLVYGLLTGLDPSSA